MEIKLPKKKPTLYDIVPITVVAVFCIVLVFVYSSRSNSYFATVKTDSGTLSLDLNDSGTYLFTSGGYEYTVEVSDGTACVTNADCPDGVCVSMGKIGKSHGGSIICVPGNFSIVCEGENSEDSADALVP